MTAHHEIEALLGAYALDAVAADEARLVEEHLAECPRCRAEVAAHREVAALLTSGSTEAVPDGVWDRIAGELGDTPPPVPLEVALERREERRRPARVLTGLAAAAAVAVLALMAGVLITQQAEVNDLRDDLAAQASLEDLVAEPGTAVVDLHSEDGTAEARAVMGEDGEAILLAGGLPELDAERTYQLWGRPEGREAMVSLAVLGADPDRSTFRVDGAMSALAISEEPGGGSTQPSSEPVVTGEIA